MNKILAFVVRSAIAAVVGAVVIFMTVTIAWKTTRPIGYVRWEQFMTQMELQKINELVIAYRRENGVPPATLDEVVLPKYGPDYVIEDGWERPFIYMADDTDYTFVSLGRDGRPGGVGLDYDLTADNAFSLQSLPTFRQFVFDCSTGRILGTCIASGIFAMTASWILAKPAAFDKKNSTDLLARITATFIGTVIIGSLLAFLHIPTGH